MTCENLIAFADGELDEGAKAVFRSHLRTCLSCQTGLVEALTLTARLSELRPRVHQPIHAVQISGWHAHRDGTWGYYSWQGGGGVVYLALDLVVPSHAATLEPADVVLAEMVARLRANGQRQEAAWCELALQGHVFARVEALKIKQRGMG